MNITLDEDHFECLYSVCQRYTQSPLKNINVTINAKMQPIEYRVDFLDGAYLRVPWLLVHDLAYEVGKTTHKRIVAEVEYVPLDKQSHVCELPGYLHDNY